MSRLIEGIQLYTLDWAASPVFPHEFHFNLQRKGLFADKVLLIVDSDALTTGAVGTIIKMRTRIVDDVGDSDSDAEPTRFADLVGSGPVTDEDIITAANPAAFKLIRRIVTDNAIAPSSSNIVSGLKLRIRLVLTSTVYDTGKTRFKVIAQG